MVVPVIYDEALEHKKKIAVPLAINFFFPKYILSLPYFFALLLTLPLSALSVVVSVFLVAFRKQKALLSQKFIRTSFPALLYFALLPLFGL